MGFFFCATALARHCCIQWYQKLDFKRFSSKQVDIYLNNNLIAHLILFLIILTHFNAQIWCLYKVNAWRWSESWNMYYLKNTKKNKRLLVWRNVKNKTVKHNFCQGIISIWNYLSISSHLLTCAFNFISVCI